MKLYQTLPQPLLEAMKGFYEHANSVKRERQAERRLVVDGLSLSAECLANVHTLGEWHAQRQEYRRSLAWMLGLHTLRDRARLEVESKDLLERSTYHVEKIVLQTLPDLWVTANFYVPHGLSRPTPCVLYLNGHWPSLNGAKTGFQDRYLWYPANGFALLVVDPLQFGEVPGVHQGTNRLNMWDWVSLGYTPAGVEVWNAMRALDFLETRPEIDSSRIGVTGISGGGVMSQYLAALDERIAAVAPSCSTYTVGTQVAGGLVPENCDCTFFPNVFGMDFPVILALIAPRPLLVLGGRKDPVFPPAGFRAAVERAKRVYDLYDSASEPEVRIRLVESRGGHADPPAFLEECHRWMTHWLGGDAHPFQRQDAAAQPRPEAPEVLRCLEEAPPTAANYHVHRFWIEKPALGLPRDKIDWQERRDELLRILRGRVLGWFPERTIGFAPKRLRHSGGFAADLTSFGEYALQSEPGVFVRVQLMCPLSPNDGPPLVVWVRRPEDQVAFPDLDEFLPLLSSAMIVAVTPRFAERPLPGPTYARIERTAALIGRTVAALQIWDVLRAVAWGRSQEMYSGGPVSVYGAGAAGVVALYAGISDAAIRHVIMRDPPGSHGQGPPLLTILRDTDLCESAALLASRRLTLLGDVPTGYDWTRRLYQLVGHPERFLIGESLAEAVLTRDVPPKCDEEWLS